MSLKGVEYRFAKDYDIIPIFQILSKLYNESRGLEELFSMSFGDVSFGDFKTVGDVVDYIEKQVN